MRVDKWLWTARLFKTRALPANAVTGGRVRINGLAAKPSREIDTTTNWNHHRRGPADRDRVRHVRAPRLGHSGKPTSTRRPAESVEERERSAELRRLCWSGQPRRAPDQA